MTQDIAIRTWGNRLLDSLPPQTQEALAAKMTRVELARGTVTTRAGAPIMHVDFPIDAIVAIVAGTPSGKTVEIAVAGSEGYVETDAPLDGDIASRSAVVRLPGSAWRMMLADFRSILDTDSAFASQVRRAMRVRLFITEQGALCNVHHTMDQRLARWLLDARDRSGREHFRVTQAELAGVLGVRRAGISLTVARLRRAGAVTNERGGMIVTDYGRLREEACECYDVMREALGRVVE
jgi:CRP-like cAMP-binding protein